MSVKAPNSIDVYVGSRIKLLRQAIEMSQHSLASLLGITFQQVQKYERGTNRVSPARLQAMAKIFNVPVSYFFDDNCDNSATLNGIELDSDMEVITSFISNRDGIALNQAFLKIKDLSTRKQIVALVKTVAGVDPPSDMSEPTSIDPATVKGQ